MAKTKIGGYEIEKDPFAPHSFFDPSGGELPEGEPGQILIYGPTEWKAVDPPFATQDALDATNENVSELSDNLTQAQQDLTAAEGHISENTEAISNLSDSLDGEENARRTADDVLAGRLTTAESDIDHLEAETDTLLSGLRQETAERTAADETLNDRITETGGKVLPSGGNAGQVLVKLSGTNYDAGWEDPETPAFEVEEVTDPSQANFCGADIRVGAAPSGGAQIQVSSGWRASLLGNQVNYSGNTASDPLTLTVNLTDLSIPTGGTRRRFTDATLWRGGKCFAFDLGGRVTAITPGSSAGAQGTNVKEPGALKYLIGAQTGGYLVGGFVTAGNGWLATWGEGAADISAFAITVSNIKYYKVVEV